MADQTVRIESMPSAGTKEAVALEMWKIMRANFRTFGDIEKDFTLFAQCLKAAEGRSVDLSNLK